MNTNIITPLDWYALGSFVFLTLIFSYQAWVNLFYGKVSRFSIDAIMVYLFLKFGSEKARKRVKAFTKNTDRILLFGVYSILSAVGGIYAIIRWVERIIP